MDFIAHDTRVTPRGPLRGAFQVWARLASLALAILGLSSPAAATDTSYASTHISGFAWGIDFSQLAGTPTGGTEILGCKNIAPGGIVPDTVAGSNSLDIFGGLGASLSPCGSPPAQGLSNKAWFGSAPFPGGPEALGFTLSSIGKDAGTPIDCQDFAFCLVFDAQYRCNDFYSPSPATTGEAIILNFAYGKFRFSLDADNRLQIGSTGGGGISNFYAFAGRNAVFVRSTHAGVTIDHYHLGRTTLPRIGASGTSAHLSLFRDTLGSGPTNGFCFLRRLWVFNSGRVSDADVAATLADCASTFGLVPHEHFVAVLWHSHGTGAYDIPGQTVVGWLANAHPSWRVLQCASPGGTTVGGTASSILDHQVPRAILALASCRPPGGRAIAIEGGDVNDAVFDIPPADINQAHDLIQSRLLTAGFDGIVGITPMPICPIGASDTTIERIESCLRSTAAHARARVGIGYTRLVDLKARYDTGSGSAADVKAAFTHMPHCEELWTPNGSDLVAASAAVSAQGIHPGPLSQAAWGGLISTATAAAIADAGSTGTQCPIINGPTSGIACPTGAASFSVQILHGLPATIQWQYRGEDGQPPLAWTTLVDGPNSLGSGSLVSATGVETPWLAVASLFAPWPLTPTGAVGSLRCIVSNACGTTMSTPVTLSICRADFNCSGSVNAEDILDFLNAWFAGSPSANFGGANSLLPAAVLGYLDAWFGGC